MYNYTEILLLAELMVYIAFTILIVIAGYVLIHRMRAL